MATVTHLFAVNDIVYHVDAVRGVRRAVVKKVTIELVPASQVIDYVIAFADAADGVIDALESTLFADVDSALAYYKTEYVTA